jgi:phosphatidylethanolamine-binding protein (PEBP) family uncharacterized protein
MRYLKEVCVIMYWQFIVIPINPPLTVDNIPENTKTLAVIVEDPDAPRGTFDHWLLWNLPPDRIIKEDTVLGASGKNSAGKVGYYPPCRHQDRTGIISWCLL